MPVPSRLDRYVETEKQRHFSRDFMIGWEQYETWDEAIVGQSGLAASARSRSPKETSWTITSVRRNRPFDDRSGFCPAAFPHGRTPSTSCLS